MNTGKIEYGPDYKSEKRNERAINLLDQWLAAPIVEETDTSREYLQRITGQLDEEHQRLKDAVVEAAKRWKIQELDLTASERTLEQELNAPIELAEAVSNLIEFEKREAQP